MSRAGLRSDGDATARQNSLRPEPPEAELSTIAAAVWRQNLTPLAPAKLRVIEATVRRSQAAGVPGDFVEFGVALSGSAVLVASYLDGPRRFIGFDVFGMIPPCTPEDDLAASRSGSSSNGGAATLPDLYECVNRTFERFGLAVDGKRIILHRGAFQNAFDKHGVQAVAFAHIDCDWYKPVKSFLSAAGKRLSRGGAIVLDDYDEHGGCRRAVDAFLDEHREFRVVRNGPSAILQYG